MYEAASRGFKIERLYRGAVVPTASKGVVRVGHGLEPKASFRIQPEDNHFSSAVLAYSPHLYLPPFLSTGMGFSASVQ
jgi:hypothetical protein